MSQYTKSGLSKPFSCCGFWKQCDMGKKEKRCHYKEVDPDTMLNCRSYQRSQNKKKEQTLDEAMSLFDEMFG